MRLRIATWNIHRCIGTDGIHSPSRCAEVLRELEADIIALQEVESTPGEATDVLAYLSNETGYKTTTGPTIKNGNTHYGNALLTAFPSGESRHHNISSAGREPRAALDVDLFIAGSLVQVINTHLGLRPYERRSQVEALLPLLRRDNRALVILAGDFNEWFLWGRPLRRLHRIFFRTPHLPSWPARHPFFALDRIWVSPPESLKNIHIHLSPLSKEASDHLPLVADIVL